MAKKDERFIKVLNEGSTWTTNREIWVDKTTGVNYLWVASGYAGGLTPRTGRRQIPPCPARDPAGRVRLYAVRGIHNRITINCPAAFRLRRGVFYPMNPMVLRQTK